MSDADRAPGEIVRVLLATDGNPSSNSRNEVLALVRVRFLAIGRKHFSILGDELEDAVQGALMIVISPRALQSIADPGMFWAWAHGVFVNVAADLRRRRQREYARRAEIPGGEDSQAWLARVLVDARDTPEALAGRREILRAALEDIRRCETAWRRWIEEHSEEEVAIDLGLRRDQIAGRIKRLRARLRERLLPETDSTPTPVHNGHSRRRQGERQ